MTDQKDNIEANLWALLPQIYMQDSAEIQSRISLTDDDKKSQEYQQYLQDIEKYKQGIGDLPRNVVLEKNIDEAIENFPYKIEAKSTWEKQVLYERLMLLSQSKLGQEIMKALEEFSKSNGKITVKEDQDLIIGVAKIETENPKDILLSSNERKSYENLILKAQKEEEKSPPNLETRGRIYGSQYFMAGTIAHETRHVMQQHHPDSHINTSLENFVKSGVMAEVSAEITNTIYEVEKGLPTPLALFYTQLKNTNIEAGNGEKEAEKKAKTSLAVALLTGGNGLYIKDEKLKESLEFFGTFYVNACFSNIAGAKIFPKTPENISREKNYLTYLCDSVELDHSVLNELEHFCDKFRQPCNMEQENFKVGSAIIKRFDENGNTSFQVSVLDEQSNTQKITKVVDGKVVQKYNQPIPPQIPNSPQSKIQESTINQVLPPVIPSMGQKYEESYSNKLATPKPISLEMAKKADSR